MARLRRLLVALRWVAVLSPGYIHPDEFFQGPEPMARDILQLQATIPWEFAEQPPCRSVISAALTSGIPLLGVRLLGPSPESHWVGAATLLAPRVWMVALSFTLDNAIVQLCEAFGRHSQVQSTLLVFGSAWPGLLMMSRPFSNSLEAVLLGAALMVTVGGRDRAGAAQRWRWFGLISALGVFTRFTFVVFGAVISIWMVVDTLGLAVLQRSFARETSVQDWHLWCKLALDICGGAAAFLAASTVIVLTDSLYFGTLSLTYSHVHNAAASVVSPAALLQRVVLGGTDAGMDGEAVASSLGLASRVARVGYTGHLTFTPLNSYRYNADPANLAQHGLHPRWTHAAVNMPMMFGPLVALGLLELLTRFGCLATSKRTKTPRNTASATSDGVRNARTERSALHSSGCNLRTLSASIVALYLGALSTAPHQEARFLLPLLLPMSILYGARIVKGESENTVAETSSAIGTQTSQSSIGEDHQPMPPLSSLLVAIWIAFNLGVSMFFGGLHQAGISRALVQFGAGSSLRPLGDDGRTSAGTDGFLSTDATRLAVDLAPASAPTTVVFFHTYMPPVALTGQYAAGLEPVAVFERGGADDPSVSRGPARLKILDLTSNSSIVALDKTVSNLLARGNTGFTTDGRGSADESTSHVFVISPGSMDLGAMFNDLYESDAITATTGARLQLVIEPNVQWWPHLSMEDPPWEAKEWKSWHIIDHLLGWTRREGDSADGLLTLVLWRARVVV
eukprot:COSAG02_NODE_970_length_15551_cov_4.985698_14_plen_738_part_00